MKRLCSVNTAFPFLLDAEGSDVPRGADTYYSEWLHVGSLHELLFLINVKAVSAGSPTLAVTLQTSPKALTAFDHTAYDSSITAAGQYTKPVTNFGKFVRLKAEVGGEDTPTVTFEAFIVAKS